MMQSNYSRSSLTFLFAALVLIAGWQGYQYFSLRAYLARLPDRTTEIRSPQPNHLRSVIERLARLGTSPATAEEIDSTLLYLDFYHLSKEDLPTVLQSVLELGDAASSSLYLALFERWSAIDPKSALAAAKSLGSENRRAHQAIRGLYFHQAEADLEPLLDLARDDRLFFAGFHDYLEGLAQRNPIKAITAAKKGEEADPTKMGVFVLTSYRSWAQHHPMEALKWATDHEEERHRGNALYAVVDAWSDSEPTQAVDSLLEREFWRDHPQLFGQALGKLAVENPGKTFQILQDIAPQVASHREGNSMIRDFQNHLWTLNSEVLESHVEQMPNSAVKDRLLFHLAKSKSIPGSVRQRLVEQLPEGEGRALALANFTNSLFDSTVRLGFEEPAALTDWLNTLSPGRSRDRSILTWSNRIALTDPVAALQAASLIDDPIDRLGTIRQVGEQWLLTNQSAAMDYLATTPYLDEWSREWLLQLHWE